MTVVLALGGSVIVPEPGEVNTDRYASHIERAAGMGHGLCVVVGGGATARSYIEAGRHVNMSEASLDRLGIMASRLNARSLAQTIDSSLNPVFVEGYEEAANASENGSLPVMGGTTPGHTTDAVAAVLAEDVDSELVVYGTSVDGIYDADPEHDTDATRYDNLSHKELVNLLSGHSRGAGASSPIDLLAAKLLQRSETPAVVVDANRENFLTETLRDDAVEGTLIR